MVATDTDEQATALFRQLDEMRELRLIPRKAVNKHLEIHNSYYSMLLSGDRHISLNLLTKYAKFVQCELKICLVLSVNETNNSLNNNLD